MNNETQDDEVLARFYKEGAKEIPSKELDGKILAYAAEKEKSKQGSSHFSGGWKVPLSMAASVVLVFAILIQIDQKYNPSEIPSTQNAGKSASGEPVMDTLSHKPLESMLEDSTDDGSIPEAAELTSRSEYRESDVIPQNKFDSKKESRLQENNVHQKIEVGRQLEIQRLNNESSKQKAAKNIPAEPDALEPQPSENTTHATSKESLDRNRTLSTETPLSTNDNRSIMQDSEDTSIAKSEAEFAPIPVGDWLLMIEKLLANKDYAEARRQIEKFKLAHPKVNIEDLESKIP